MASAKHVEEISAKAFSLYCYYSVAKAEGYEIAILTVLDYIIFLQTN